MTPRRIAIVGGGIAGLSAAFFLKKAIGESAEIMVFEKESRLGGTIGVTRRDGYIADWGPNGFLDREPLTLEFVNDIGLRSQLLPSNEKSEKRFIYRNGKLWEISANPIKFLASGLLSMSGRLRIGMEYFKPPKTDNGDESIFDFAARRIGTEAAEIMIDPMVSGIFGGDARSLSLGACFPAMEEMERQYGGLIKAMLGKQKEKKRQGIQKKGSAGSPTGHLTSFHGGLFTLVEHLERLMASHIRKNTHVTGVYRDDSGRYRLTTGVDTFDFDEVILAVPSYQSAELLKEIAPGAAAKLGKIPYASLTVVCHGYRRSDINHDVNGFGFLVPFNQRLAILGSIWTSVIFPEQAPAEQILFRTMLGGARNNEMVDLEDKALAGIAHQNLATIIDIKSEPCFLEVIRWKDAIPQYTLGHRDRLASIESALGTLGRIYLAGNAYTGISLNDTIKRSYMISQIIASKNQP